MSQFYLNAPAKGYAMTAEEFAAGTACRRPGPPPQEPGCGCGGTPAPPSDCGCGGAMPPSDCPDSGCGQGPDYCQPMICCCRPAPAPAPQPPQVEEGCCCKQSFRAALSLLCDERIASLLDFDTSAFLTGTYTAGTTLQSGKPRDDDAGEADAERRPALPTPPCPCGTFDNLGSLSGSFRRFAPCSCDLLDVDAEVYTPSGKHCSLTAQQVNLCQLDAVVIQSAAACAEGDLTAEEATARNFRCIRSLLTQRLSPVGSPCGQTACSCACDGRDCCCAAGLLSTLAQNNLSRRVSLTAGLLVLRNAQLLGTMGNVLVLANEANNRLYFVCVNSVQFIG